MIGYEAFLIQKGAWITKIKIDIIDNIIIFIWPDKVNTFTLKIQ